MSEMETPLRLRAALVADAPDHEGVDEWYVGVFDENGDHSDDLFERERGMYQGTFRQCVQEAGDFVARKPNMQLRVTIGRVC